MKKGDSAKRKNAKAYLEYSDIVLLQTIVSQDSIFLKISHQNVQRFSKIWLNYANMPWTALKKISWKKDDWYVNYQISKTRHYFALQRNGPYPCGLVIWPISCLGSDPRSYRDLVVYSRIGQIEKVSFSRTMIFCDCKMNNLTMYH